MAEEETIVLDISSDEDVGWGDSVAGCGSDGERGGGGGGGGSGDRDDVDWISELLDEVHKETDDADEVVVVGEVIAAKPKVRVSTSSVKCVNKIADADSDDECVVLDGDPDKPVEIENDRREDDSDELLVVSEKGQVACRDYPHARNLCVKFPFSSTPHDRHCDQCHCYVCDSLAPCLQWSTTNSSIDHCHATDKDEFWKAQRKSSKKNDKAPPTAPGVPDTSFYTGLAPVLPSDPLLQNKLLVTQAAQQLSSMPTSNGTPNLVTHGRIQQSGNYMRNKYQPHFVSQQLRSPYSNVIPGDRRHNAGPGGTHFISRVPFKRTGRLGGVLPTNRYCNNSSRISHGYQFPRSHPPVARWLDPSGGVAPVMNAQQDSSRSNVGGMSTSLMSNLPGMTNMVNRTANRAPSQPQIFPQTHESIVDTNTVGPQHQLSSQMYEDFNFPNLVRTQPNWDCPFDNSFPFQPQAASNPNDARISQVPVLSEPLVSSLGNMNNCFESAVPTTQLNADSGFENPLPYRPQVGAQPASLSYLGADTFQQGNRTQGTLHPSSNEFDFSVDSPTSHSNQPLVVEYNQLENSVQINEPAINVDGGSQLPGSTNTSPFDFQYDDPWNFENQSCFVPVLPDFNVFSPEAAPIDAGLLFDI
ncbi:hypothetical protein ACH5RR_020340 [Cinchona calisaya]|uniref:Uncharacterized protein n=1 Tax=Cinchona calisaya TaxID=153742 RepID=A0ABD2ZFZ0_9GENT